MMAAYLLMAVVGYLVLGVAYYASKRPSYSHFQHTISELGETGSAYAKPVGYGLFLPVGLACLWSAYLAHDRSEPVAIILALMGLSYSMAAFFPCDPETPAIGSWQNTVHNVVGGICYIGMGLQLRELSDQGGATYFGVSFLLLAAFLIMFVIGWPKRLIGLAQRLAEASIFASAFLTLQ